MSALAAIPEYAVDELVTYVDYHDRVQFGRVLHIEANWYGERRPLIVYTLAHPTARNKRQYVTADQIRCRTPTFTPPEPKHPHGDDKPEGRA